MSYGGAIAPPTLRRCRLNAILSRGFLGAICAVPGGAAADAIAGRTASPAPTPAFANHAAPLADAETREPLQDPHTRANRAPEAEVVTRTIGSLTLHIPEGYLDRSIAYPNYVVVHALLPCLAPETPANAPEFHKNILGHVLIADLSNWDPHDLIGKQLLEMHLRLSQSARLGVPAYAKASIYQGKIPNTDFQFFKDYLLAFDVFADSSREPPFVLACKWQKNEDKWLGVPFPDCDARDRVWDKVLLEYRYSRDWIDKNVEYGIVIDRNLRTLLNSFLQQPARGTSTLMEGHCQ